MLQVPRRTVIAGMAIGLTGLSLPAAGQSAGKFSLAIPQQPTTFQPYFYSVAFYHLYNQFYNVLVRLNKDQKPQPELAKSWTLSADGLELTLQLRDNVKFHSGRVMKADDVKRSWQLATSDKVQSNSAPLFSTIDHIDIVNDTTVKLVFKAPNPGLYDLLDQLWIVDADNFDKSATQPVGTGPFVLADYRPGDKLVLKPFADYWDAGKPKLAEVDVSIITDPQALILNLQSGTVDAIGQVNVIDADRLAKAGFVVETASEGIIYCVMFNDKTGPFAGNRKLHEAFVHAIDRDRFNRIVLAGKARTMCMPWLPTSFAYDAALEKTCDFNLDEAKSLLAEAGYPNGMDITIVTSTDWYYGMTKLAEILQSDLKQIGVNVTIDDVESAEYAKRHNSFDYEVIMTLTGRVNRDPATMLTSTNTMRAKDNAAGYNNPHYIELVSEAAGTVDPVKRRALFDQINKIIREDMYTMPVATSPFLFGYNKKVKNISYSTDGFVYLADVTVT